MGSRFEANRPNTFTMDDELWYLQDALAMRERLRVLADLQASYWEALVERGFDASVATQFTADWSNLAYGMTFQSGRSAPRADSLDTILAGALQEPLAGAQPAAPVDDPSTVPPGEPWLLLVQDAEVGEADADEPRDAAA